MNETQILCQILNCWVLDLQYLMDLLKNNQIELDIFEIKDNYQSLDINTLIYEAIRKIRDNFIQENAQEIWKILNLRSYNELENFLSYNDIDEIYINFLDSHLSFKNYKIQEMFENSRYSV